MAKERASQAKNTLRLYVEIDPALRTWLDEQKEIEQRSLRVIVERALRNEKERVEAEAKAR